MGLLLIITGPPGSGKSTVAPLLAARFSRSVLMTGDSFFGFLASGSIPPWLPGSEQQNDVTIEAAALAAGRFARADYTVVFEGMVGPWYLSRFVETAGAPDTHYAVLLPEVEVCVQRVLGRANHGFNDEPATRHLHQEFTAHPLPATHVVLPQGNPEATADLLHERLLAGAFAVTPR